MEDLPLSKKLCYRSGPGWKIIPSWSQFLIEIGWKLARFPAAQPALAVGMALPTRTMAATLVGCGIVAERSKTRAKIDDWEIKLKLLEQLPYDAPVTLLKGGRRVKGKFKRIKVEDGVKFVEVQVGGKDKHGCGRATISVPVKRCGGIEPIQKEVKKLPVNPSGVALARNRDFLKYALKETDLDNFTGVSRLDCLFIGPAANIRQEAKDLELGIQAILLNSKDYYSASPADILRARQVQSEGIPYRSEIFSAISDLSNKSIKEAPHVVIFDGGLGFDKWRHLFQNSHWLVVLDRSDHHFELGRQLLAADSLGRERADAVLDDLVDIPDSLELMAYMRNHCEHA